MGVQDSPLLDCTLRDGSYQINFGFSSAQTSRIVGALHSAGISLIEVGHGVGVGASSKISEALQTDIEYGQAAESAAPGAWGMFAIPEIASLDEIRGLVDLGMGFLRVGVDFDKQATGLEFVRQLLKTSPNLVVFVNFMKSYAAEPKELGFAAQAAFGSGANGVYLVDSAGGMTPSQIRDYCEALLPLKDSGWLGFHGHDNLGLAVSNSLEALNLGFDFVDCTLQGLGRSSGNAPTEKLAALLIKNKFLSEERLAVIDLCKIAEVEISPLPQDRKVHGLDVMAGFTDFHSSHMSALLRESARADVDAYELMRAVTTTDKINLSDKTLKDCSGMLPRLSKSNAAVFFDSYSGADDQV